MVKTIQKIICNKKLGYSREAARRYVAGNFIKSLKVTRQVTLTSSFVTTPSSRAYVNNYLYSVAIISQACTVYQILHVHLIMACRPVNKIS